MKKIVLVWPTHFENFYFFPRSRYACIVMIFNILIVSLSVILLIFGFIFVNLLFKSTDFYAGNCMKNGRCKGHMVQIHKTENYHECFKNCQNISRCNWISYNGLERECYLYSICEDISSKVKVLNMEVGSNPSSG